MSHLPCTGYHTGMRYTFIAMGSRGDVQPYIALGAGVRRAGHDVRFATHAEFRALAEEQGLEFTELCGSPQEMLDTDTARAMLDARANPLKFLTRFHALTMPYFLRALDEMHAVSAGAEALVLSGTAIFPGFPIAEKLGIPACAGVLQPLSATAAFENAFFPACPRWFPARELYNRLTHLAFMGLVAAFFGQGVAPMRRRLALPPMTLGEMFARLKAPPGLTLYGISPSVLPQPADWPAFCRMTGYWYLDAAPGWTPPAELAAFLDDGPPPVYIGFGSIRNEDPAAMARVTVRALELSGQRGILFRGWGGLQPGDLPPTIRAIDPVPHSWLFPRMAAVAHHGGAGTTAAAFRAGVPGIAMPVFADQPYWARHIQRLGAGPAPVPRWQLTPERLAAAIRQAVQDDTIRANAAALGEKIRAEDGVGEAVKLIEEACGSTIPVT